MRTRLAILLAVSVTLFLASIAFAQDEEPVGQTGPREAEMISVPVNLDVYHTVPEADRTRPLTVLEQRMVNTAPAKEKARVEELLRVRIIHPTVCTYHGKHGGVPVEGCKKCGVYPRQELALRSEVINATQQAWQGPKKAVGTIDIPLPQGPPGAKGDKGDRGDQGPPGTGVVNNYFSFAPPAQPNTIPLVSFGQVGGSTSTYQIGAVSIGLVPKQKFCLSMTQILHATLIANQNMQQGINTPR